MKCLIKENVLKKKIRYDNWFKPIFLYYLEDFETLIEMNIHIVIENNVLIDQN